MHQPQPSPEAPRPGPPGLPGPPRYPSQPGPLPRPAARQPTRVEPVPGTPYGLAIYGPLPTTSGPAIGSLVAGVAAVLVSLAVACLGLADVGTSAGGQAGGWGLLVGGAFAILAGFLGLVAVVVGLAGLRQTRADRPPAGEPVRGRGMAITGLSCGAAAIVITLCAIGVSAAATFA